MGEVREKNGKTNNGYDSTDQNSIDMETTESNGSLNESVLEMGYTVGNINIWYFQVM